MHFFEANIDIIGVNPYVFVPETILQAIFKEANKSRGPIPIRGTINGQNYTQTLVKFSGEWRLYINTSMLKNSPQRVGERIEISVAFDSVSREIECPSKFKEALNNHPEAKAIFNRLSASRRLEIVRYLARLKSEESLDKNIVRAINFLMGKERFVGRDKP